MPILHATASQRSTAGAREVLDELWSALEDGGELDARSMVKAIERLPEARITDSNRREFLAMEALGSVFSAASLWDPAYAATYQPGHITPHIWSGFDGIVRQLTGDGRPRIIDPRNPPPPGPFEHQEDLSIEEDVRSLEATDPRSVAAMLRDRARERATQLAPEVRALVSRAFDDKPVVRAGEIELRAPWAPVPSADNREALEAELRRELGAEHRLARRSWRAIARRYDQDEVLLGLDDGSWAIVHLTWTGNVDADVTWPRTEVLATREEVHSRMARDAAALA